MHETGRRRNLRTLYWLLVIAILLVLLTVARVTLRG